MRPHLLEFGGIGTYPKDTSIDFDKLSDLGLYLIVGPTGAGKSTIFDALTYALYGEVAGERPKATIVSDHDHRVTPYINLEFSHRDMRYRIKRKPPLEGRSPKTNDQVFIECDANGIEVQRITGAGKVTEAVANVIGLDAKQFMRVILLPQNEFREFLVAPSSQKVELLRALFDTKMYESIATRLDLKAKDFNTAAKGAENAIEIQKTVARNAVETLVQGGFLAELPEEIDIDDFISLVRPLAEQALADSQLALAEFEAAVQNAQNAENEAKRFDDGARRAELIATIELNAEKFADSDRLISDHLRALPLVSHIDNARLLADKATNASNSVITARTELGIHADSFSYTSPNLGHVLATGTLQEIQSAVAATKIDLGIFEEVLSQIASLEETIRSKSEEYEDANSQLTDLNVQLVVTSELVTQLEKTVDEAKEAQIKAVELLVKTTALDEKILQADVAGAQKELVRITDAYNESKELLNAAAKALNAALDERTKHLAGELASGLKENEECPVCGSTSHPRKAPPSADSDPKSLQDERDKAQTEFSQQEAFLTHAQAAVEEAQAVANTLPSEAEQSALRQQLADTRGLAEGLPAAESALKDTKANVESVKTRIQTATTVRDIAAQLRDKAKAELDKEFNLPSGFTATKLAEEKENLRESERLVDKLASCVHDESIALSSASEAQRTVDSMLKNSSLLSEEEALALVLSPDAYAVHSTVVREQSERLEEVKLLEAKIGVDPLPAVRPDVDSLHTEQENKKSKSETASSTANLLSNKLNDLQKVKKDLATIGPEATQARERAREAQKMADIIKKGETGRLSLEKWVQRTLFEEVCEVASHQISTLSSGRYLLTLENEGQKTGNKSEGLDIFVIDGHTGKTRAVQTLSGGEQFLTSLALALALAEVVQRHSGGVEISSLFIDEGFGSLDADNLEIAVDVLRSLQNSGRTVGVISHVESMQHDLTVGIRVSRSPSGSTLQVLA